MDESQNTQPWPEPDRRAWPLSLLVLVGWAVTTMGLHLLQTGGRPMQLTTLIKAGVSWGVTGGSLFIIVAITLLGWWNVVGIRRPVEPELLAPLAIVFALFAAAIASHGLPRWHTVAIVALNTLLVGTSEELMFRGVLFHGAKVRFGGISAVLITAAIFGPLHTLNGFVTGHWGVSTLQAIFAASFGLWIGALRLRTKSVLPLIITHALWDGMLVLGGVAAAPAALFSAVMLTGYGVWLLRDTRRRERSAVTLG